MVAREGVGNREITKMRREDVGEGELEQRESSYVRMKGRSENEMQDLVSNPIVNKMKLFPCKQNGVV